jgi:hypothetical protein
LLETEKSPPPSFFPVVVHKQSVVVLFSS